MKYLNAVLSLMVIAWPVWAAESDPLHLKIKPMSSNEQPTICGEVRLQRLQTE